ncbi:LuxR family transcriptional regulator [Nesterenkonia sp. AN1]|uniref:response regulator n=1 Tax=Nesterenkonia sp. AN1 TaxID=652017 RepID=UPI000452F666|nr:response regulator transcription factor [Nesterenkonia sp. AN1]EXF25530.1 LuxR family transcriptional regulator [Nesterenkonia sp. AN1]
MNQDLITVLLADDHSSIRAGLRLLLETAEGIEVIGEAADGAGAVNQVSTLRPDVVLMDARMPGIDGIAATRKIVAGFSTQVLMLTTFDLDEVVFGSLRAGAAGFLLKSVEPAQLIDAIRRVAAGDGVLAPEVTRKLLREFAGGGAVLAEAGAGGCPTGPGTSRRQVGAPSSAAGGSGELSEQLTPRELDVLAALGRGLSNAAIAQELFVSLATVKTHVSNILSKQQLNSRMQAAILAREVGLA